MEMEEKKQNNTHFTPYFLVVVKPQGVPQGAWLSIIQNSGKSKKTNPKKDNLAPCPAISSSTKFPQRKESLGFYYLFLS